MLPHVGTIALFLAKSSNAMEASSSCRQRDTTVGTGFGVNFGAGFGLGIRFGIGLRNTAPLVVKPRRRTYGRHCTRQLNGNGIFNGSRREQRRSPDGRGLEQILTHLGSRIQPSCLCRSILFSEFPKTCAAPGNVFQFKQEITKLSSAMERKRGTIGEVRVRDSESDSGAILKNRIASESARTLTTPF